MSMGVTRHEYGSRWPFTVSEGVLTCRDSGVTAGATEMKEVLFTADGITYALNGYAKGRRSYQDVTAIWADDPAIPGAKKDIGPIINRALNSAEAPLPETSVAARPLDTGASAGSPPARLDANVRKYNAMLRQAQRVLAEKEAAWQRYLRAVNDWEAAHGEKGESESYPASVTALASSNDRLRAELSRCLKSAAALLQAAKADPALDRYYSQGEQAISDEDVPGLLIGTDAEHLRFAERRH
jgi:hypothetical protein